MTDRISLSLFADHVGEQFRIVLDQENSLEVELIEAKALKSHVTEDDPEYIRRDPFCLLFRGPKDCYLPQRMYAVEHPTAGTVEMFLVPVMPDRHGSRFEAIFN